MIKAKHILGNKALVNAHRGEPLKEGQRLILINFFQQLDSEK
jgi:hypothetical protein